MFSVDLQATRTDIVLLHLKNLATTLFLSCMITAEGKKIIIKRKQLLLQFLNSYYKYSDLDFGDFGDLNSIFKVKGELKMLNFLIRKAVSFEQEQFSVYWDMHTRLPSVGDFHHTHL